MKTDTKTAGQFRLTSCTYGVSRVAFRGPNRPTTGRYVVFLGGSQTFARYVPNPFPDMIETEIGEVCVNLGCHSAGPDVFLHDTAVQALCHDAALTVIQVMGAANLSNRFYKVHPRRNDRFIAPEAALKALYPEVDFTEFAFVGHLLAKLVAVDPVRFEQVRKVLQVTWVRRMKALIGKATAPVVLLWFAPRAPDAERARVASPANEPLFVNRAMFESLRPHVAHSVEVVARCGDTAGMVHAPLELLAAQDTLGVVAHKMAAKALRLPITAALS